MARKRNLSSLTLDFSNIDPEDIKSARFDVSKNTVEANRLLDSYDDNRVKKVRVNFEDSKWIFKEEFTRSDAVFSYKKIEDSLSGDGYFIAEFFSTKQISFNSGGPKDLDLLYTIEDFSNHFNLCKKNITEEIVVLDEGIGHQGEACVIRVVIKKI